MSEDIKPFNVGKLVQLFVNAFVVSIAVGASLGFFTMIYEKSKSVDAKAQRNAENIQQVYVNVKSSQEQFIKDYSRLRVNQLKIYNQVDNLLTDFDDRMKALEKKNSITPKPRDREEISNDVYSDIEKKLKEDARNEIDKRANEIDEEMQQQQQMQK